MTVLVLLALAAGADPIDVLRPDLRRIYLECREHEARGRWDKAQTCYALVARSDPAWHQAVLDLGRVLEAQEDWTEAVRSYESLPDDADAVEALGRLQLARGWSHEAAATFARLRNLRQEWPGTRVLEARSHAATDPGHAAELLREYLGFTLIELEADGAVPVVVEVAEALLAEGRPDDAERLLADLRVVDPSAPVRDVEDRIAVENLARKLAAAADVPLSSPRVEALRGAREAFARGDAAGAQATLEAIVAEQPSSAVAWGTLADVREAQGDLPGAVDAIRRAERLDPRSADWPARHGDLLSRWYAGRYDEDAAQAYAEAVRRDAGDPELWHRKALADRRAGHWRQSVAAFERVVALDPDGPHAAEARRAIAGGALPEPPALPALQASTATPYHRALAWRERGDPDRALAELAVARKVAPGDVRPIDLEAAIRTDRGELEAAVRLSEESLRIAPDRGDVVGRLAVLHQRLGHAEEAAAFRREAARLGDPDALWARAQAEAASYRWFAAQRTLDAFFAHATAGPEYEQALLLDAELEGRIRASSALAVVGGAGVIALPLGIRLRRRSGASLARLLERDPGTWRDVARILSAIRHEVLKHHASVLPAVADALELGETEPARWAADRLFGEQGALARLDGYVRDLERLGAAVGVRLNLRHRDRVLGPLLAAASRLARLERAMRSGQGRRLPQDLHQVSEALNREAYRALGRLVAGLCMLPLTERLLLDVYRRAAAEFRGVPVPDVRVTAPDDVLSVRMFRADLDDVVGNLVRNAIEASLECGADEVGIALGVDEDPITGLERVAIRVLDRSPRKLTTATLRGRYVARGLGLAVDLTSRAGGSIHVEPVPGWSKAVVVRLPRAEPMSEES